MYLKTLKAALVASALMVTGAHAQQVDVTWWDFLGGGDGVRMKSLLEDFNKEHAGKIQVNATTLDWGIPFYSKVQTSAAVGEGPDVMTYHASRIPLAVSQGTLSEITPDDMTAMGLSADTFAPATWQAVQDGGKQYAVPFDTHPIVLYYNKDKLAAAGLLDDKGLPMGLNGIDNFAAAMKKLQDGGTKWGMALTTADGGFAFRLIYSYLCQQDGVMLKDATWLPDDSPAKLANAVKVLFNQLPYGRSLRFADPNKPQLHGGF